MTNKQIQDLDKTLKKLDVSLYKEIKDYLNKELSNQEFRKEREKSIRPFFNKIKERVSSETFTVSYDWNTKIVGISIYWVKLGWDYSDLFKEIAKIAHDTGIKVDLTINYDVDGVLHKINQ
jgi:hypothetical protein